MGDGHSTIPKTRGGAVSSTPPSQDPPETAPLGIRATVKSLSSAKGRAAAYAELYQLALKGGSRDYVSGLTLAKHCIDRFAALEKDRELPDRLSDLEAQLAEVKAALAGRKGSALRSEDAVVPPMTEESAIRTDMAPAPAAQGHREPYQS